MSTPVHNGGTDGTLHAAGATVAEDATVPEHVASFGTPHAGVRAAPAALAANRRGQGPLEGLLAAVKKQKEVKKQERADVATVTRPRVKMLCSRGSRTRSCADPLTDTITSGVGTCQKCCMYSESCWAEELPESTMKGLAGV